MRRRYFPVRGRPTRPWELLAGIIRLISARRATRYAAGSIVVVLEPDVAAVFPSAGEANEALRALAESSTNTGPSDSISPERLTATAQKPRGAGALESLGIAEQVQKTYNGNCPFEEERADERSPIPGRRSWCAQSSGYRLEEARGTLGGLLRPGPYCSAGWNSPIIIGRCAHDAQGDAGGSGLRCGGVCGD